MMRRHSFAALAVTALAVTGLALGCSDTNAPLPDPEEVLLAVNSTANTLSIVPVEAPSSAVTVPLGGTTPTPTGVSAREGVAIVPLGLDNAVAVVDLRTATVMRTIPLPENSGATGSAIVDDSIAYVGNPNINTVSRINYLTGATSEVPAGVYPSGLIFTRGKVFVINANLDDDVQSGRAELAHGHRPGHQRGWRRASTRSRSPAKATPRSRRWAPTACSTS